MNAQERLAAAIHNGREEVKFHEATYTQDARDDARGAIRADPHLVQDLADGQAMRLLREALPEGFDCEVTFMQGDDWEVAVFDGSDVVAQFTEGTIAEAADACRKALEARS